MSEFFLDDQDFIIDKNSKIETNERISVLGEKFKELMEKDQKLKKLYDDDLINNTCPNNDKDNNNTFIINLNNITSPNNFNNFNNRKCNNGHQLKYFKNIFKKKCDNCKQGSLIETWSCLKCNYYLCKDCFTELSLSSRGNKCCIIM